MLKIIIYLFMDVPDLRYPANYTCNWFKMGINLPVKGINVNKDQGD